MRPRVRILPIRPVRKHMNTKKKGVSTAITTNAFVFWLQILQKRALIYRSGGAMVAHEAHTLETWFESNGCIHSRQGDYQNPWE